MCGQQTLYVRDSKQRFIGRISVGSASGHVDKAGRVYTHYLSSTPCWPVLPAGR